MQLPITITTKTGNTCTLKIVDYDYVMTGATGTHKLFAHTTDDRRLWAHWSGFVQNNGGFKPAVKPMQAGSSLRVFRNQANREAIVCAVIGDRALIEYVMPTGCSALNFIPVNGNKNTQYRSVSYNALPKKWARAMIEQTGETEWFYGKPMDNSYSCRSCPTPEQIVNK